MALSNEQCSIELELVHKENVEGNTLTRTIIYIVGIKAFIAKGIEVKRS